MIKIEPVHEWKLDNVNKERTKPNDVINDNIDRTKSSMTHISWQMVMTAQYPVTKKRSMKKVRTVKNFIGSFDHWDEVVGSTVSFKFCVVSCRVSMFWHANEKYGTAENVFHIASKTQGADAGIEANWVHEYNKFETQLEWYSRKV